MHVCEKCGESNPVANRYCLKCGTELPDPTTISDPDVAAAAHEAIARAGDEAAIEQFDTTILRFP